jgi:enoyl-CoA hydratase/carnithine racemase
VFRSNVAFNQKLVCKQMFMPVQYRMFSDMNYDNILVEKKEGGVALVTLNRPKALNALCHALFNDLADAMSTLDKDPEVSAIVLTGSEKAFAAGADIKEMQPRTFPDTYLSDMLTWWD